MYREEIFSRPSADAGVQSSGLLQKEEGYSTWKTIQCSSSLKTTEISG